MIKELPRFFCQSDAQWRYITLGHGPDTIGDAGCLLVCLVDAELALTGKTIGVVEANKLGRSVPGIFVDRTGTKPGSRMVLAALAKEMGISVDRDERVIPSYGPGALQTSIQNTLARGGVCILWVDHNSTKAKGDPEGDHFVLAVRIEGVDLVYTDPAFGREGKLPLKNLQGLSMWKDKRPYRVMAVQPVSLLH